jgi:hypothetical protein
LFVALAAIGAAVAIASVPAIAASKVKVTGTFSIITFNKESGDLSGEEVRLFYVGEGEPVALVQVTDSNGGQAGLEAVTVKGDEIDIVFAKALSGAIGLHGKVTAAGMTGALRFPTGAPERFFLKRGKSYWD